MLRDSQLRHPLALVLLCAMFLAVRVGGSHLHLCYDGAEPLASLHLVDDGLHHGAPDADAGHQDADVPVAAEGLVKAAKLDFDLPLLLLTSLLLWSWLRPTQQPAPGYRNPPAPAAGRYLRPPLRGPPLLTSS